MTSTPDDEPSGFLSRWSRRKVQVRQGAAPAEPVPEVVSPPAPLVAAATLAPVPAAATVETPRETPPAPTLADVAALGPQSDYTRFIAPGVDSGVKNAALKKLFTDPHFNLMDGLDTYIDDYGKPDPLPEGMLRQMAQSQFLGLFDHEKPPAESAAGPAADPPPVVATAPTDSTLDTDPDEDADLRLQPHDAAGPPGPGAGPEPDAGRPG
jgi:hypothetical protein